MAQARILIFLTLITLAVVACKEKPAPAKPEDKTFTDSRDGKTYKFVKINNQTWMAENLNFEFGNSKCYDNEAENCEKYGRLYSWKDANAVCPPGWHLPSDEEWNELVAFVGEEEAGKKLKSKNGWDEEGNGTDEYDFSALPGGLGWSRGFNNAGNLGYWWSASDVNRLDAWSRNINYSHDVLFRYLNDKIYMYSVRCIKDT